MRGMSRVRSRLLACNMNALLMMKEKAYYMR